MIMHSFVSQLQCSTAHRPICSTKGIEDLALRNRELVLQQFLCVPLLSVLTKLIPNFSAQFIPNKKRPEPSLILTAAVKSKVTHGPLQKQLCSLEKFQNHAFIFEIPINQPDDVVHDCSTSRTAPTARRTGYVPLEAL